MINVETGHEYDLLTQQSNLHNLLTQTCCTLKHASPKPPNLIRSFDNCHENSSTFNTDFHMCFLVNSDIQIE